MDKRRSRICPGASETSHTEGEALTPIFGARSDAGRPEQERLRTGSQAVHATRPGGKHLGKPARSASGRPPGSAPLPELPGSSARGSVRVTAICTAPGTLNTSPLGFSYAVGSSRFASHSQALQAYVGDALFVPVTPAGGLPLRPLLPSVPNS